MKKLFLALMWSVVAFAACDDDTAQFGYDVMPEGDDVVSSSETFQFTTRTIPADSVLANTSTCYLGSIVDPELQIKTTSDFMAQFHVPDDFVLPAQNLMVVDEDNGYIADSCDVRLYIDSFYGDSLATMNLKVWELDKDNTLEENKNYYTNIEPTHYIKGGTSPLKNLTYTVKDLTRPESETNGSTYYRQVVVKLPREYGEALLRSYYANPSNFADSYRFIHNVCPGFYFESAGGTGVMVKSAMMAMNVYFRYVNNNDTIDGMERFGATEEVLQTTHIRNEYPANLSQEAIENAPYTLIKSPAAYFTEITLPVSEMIDSAAHYTDSINQVRLLVRKYSDEQTTNSALPLPQYVVMLRKSQVRTFFENNRLPDSSESFLSTACTGTNSYYLFSNISQLITNLRLERDKGCGVRDENGNLLITSKAERLQKYKEWQAQNEDWNKVVLVPIEPSYSTSTSGTSTVNTLRAVKNQLGMKSIRLEGGKDNPLTLEAIFSHNKRNQ